MLFWKREEQVEEMMQRYFDECDRCFDFAKTAFETYFAHGPRGKLEEEIIAVHRVESSADDLRRDIELLLYGKALLPESRGDILGILETYDRLPNCVETAIWAIATQGTVFPDELVPKVKELVTANFDAYRLARKAIDALFTNPRATLHTTKEVDHKESASDRLERVLIRAIFDMEVDTGKKMELKEIVLLIGDIADRAENLADRIGLVAIKRQI